MGVAGHNALGLTCPRKGDEVVIAPVGCRDGLSLRVSGPDAVFGERAQQSFDQNQRDCRFELRTPENALNLGDQQRTYDHVELAVGPPLEDLRRAAGRREQRRHVDVGVEDYPSHSAARRVLLSDRHLYRLILTHALCGCTTISQNRLYPFTATYERQVALVR